jgi:predicted nucleic acid-binding Zn ribbon protein
MLLLLLKDDALSRPERCRGKLKRKLCASVG